MSKKYIRKYYPTSYEGFDSDEANHIVKGITKYRNNEFIKQYVIFILICIVVVVVTAYWTMNGG